MHKGINTSVDEGQTPIVCATSKTTHALTAEGFDAGEDGTGRGTPVIGVNGRQDPVFGAISGALDTFASTQCVAFHENQRAEITVHDTAGAINTGGGKPGQGYPAVMQNLSVRRLTPVECERLQGFGDGYTAVQYRGKPASDGARYRALGNSMAVPVVRWIGQRIAMTHGRQGPAWP